MGTKLNLMCSLSNTGYGIASKYIARELAKRDVDITIFPKGNLQADNDVEQTFFTDRVKKIDFDPAAPCLNIWHQHDLMQRVGTGIYYAFPIFELDTFTPVEKAHLKVPHKILVTSEWARGIVKHQTGRQDDSVGVVPLGVNSSIFKPLDSPRNEDTYRFINIGKWEKRKGHDILCRAFDMAFENNDNVQLHLCPNNPFLTEEEVNRWHSMYRGMKLSGKVVLHGYSGMHRDIATLINSTDCGVFPSRAEGWNMELLETMACGKPVITTNFSAHTEFCTKDNAHLIEITDLEDAHDGKWFFGQGKWAEFEYEQINQLVEYMRHCYKNRPKNPHGVETAHKFSWKNSVDHLLAEGKL